MSGQCPPCWLAVKFRGAEAARLILAMVLLRPLRLVLFLPAVLPALVITGFPVWLAARLWPWHPGPADLVGIAAVLGFFPVLWLWGRMAEQPHRFGVLGSFASAWAGMTDRLSKRLLARMQALLSTSRKQEKRGDI